MKNLLLLISISISILFTSCEKKSDDIENIEPENKSEFNGDYKTRISYYTASDYTLFIMYLNPFDVDSAKVNIKNSSGVIEVSKAVKKADFFNDSFWIENHASVFGSFKVELTVFKNKEETKIERTIEVIK
ncbi:hypothetical protein [Solitalea koreensis]|uniref:Lipoprotein n=1 Tax=Solitalea koreensis TaxID=543615 RepID=A0A521BLT7_9SPHI|nr:hypothetical protein [Solitalea koreensis]SMO48059.1 hypothetical protein SAMN06265350_102317 [Solitalea koreensis]